ncbi:protein maelstrom homolog [Anopheles nili]|uniref:protein maelstrom homolog n=1 Tax=Anopheles nili TaxID=185578 RepID=UPI00237B1497|nr:protein maelstrom homolog [Anopheles nili]
MPSKKKNAFYYFMMEFKKKEEAKGRNFKSIHDVTSLAGAIWPKMNQHQRLPYEQMAKQKIESTHGEKFTNLGIPFSRIDAERREKELKEEQKISRVTSLVSDAVAKNALESQDFYIISMGYFCVTSTGSYIPAELGVIRYSLEGGVKDKLHMLINPGPLPLGMALEAQTHSDEDHQLPNPPNAMGEKDFDEIAMKLLSFLLKGESMPLLFTNQDEVAGVENMLCDILDQHMEGSSLIVCRVSHLFFQLKQNAEKYMMSHVNFPSEHMAQQIITRDPYDFTKGISCDFHEAKDNVKHCALSRCVRWAYVISDNCCVEMGIEPLPGVHLPANANINPTPSTCDTMSFVSQCSYMSSSNVSQLTQPVIERRASSSLSSQMPNERASGSGIANPHTNPWGWQPAGLYHQTQPDDDKTELQETIKRDAETSSSSFNKSWGESAQKQMSYGRGSSVALKQAKTIIANIRGAGRGRGMLDQFPPLGGTGHR